MFVSLPPELVPTLALTGLEWPEVDADALEEIAASYRAYAVEVDAAREDADYAADTVLADNAGPATDNFAAYWSRVSGDQLTGIVTASGALAKGYTDAAQGVRETLAVALGEIRALHDTIQAAVYHGQFPTDPGEQAADHRVLNATTRIKAAFDEVGVRLAATLRTAYADSGMERLDRNIPYLTAETSSGSDVSAVGAYGPMAPESPAPAVAGVPAVAEFGPTAAVSPVPAVAAVGAVGAVAAESPTPGAAAVRDFGPVAAESPGPGVAAVADFGPVAPESPAPVATVGASGPVVAQGPVPGSVGASGPDSQSPAPVVAAVGAFGPLAAESPAPAAVVAAPGESGPVAPESPVPPEPGSVVEFGPTASEHPVPGTAGFGPIAGENPAPGEAQFGPTAAESPAPPTRIASVSGPGDGSEAVDPLARITGVLG